MVTVQLVVSTVIGGSAALLEDMVVSPESRRAGVGSALLNAHRMFERVNAVAGTGATLHSLRHTTAYRMAEDPALPLTDVQFVLGHAQLSTTDIYLTPQGLDIMSVIGNYC